jgi:SAM-dependent methyltransferase
MLIGRKLLDVGCAHGWFLSAARQHGFDVVGVEPDRTISRSFENQDFLIKKGFFPDVLEEHEKYDVIAFNDVFEHIENLENTLQSCQKHLNLGGILIISLPSSNGAIYSLARIMARVGFVNLFERLWQKDFPSPHLHYFNRDNLSCLLKSYNFSEVACGRLDTLRPSGLYKRVSFYEGHSVISRVCIFTAAYLSLPILRFASPDLIYSISKKI